MIALYARRGLCSTATETHGVLASGTVRLRDNRNTFAEEEEEAESEAESEAEAEEAEAEAEDEEELGADSCTS